MSGVVCAQQPGWCDGIMPPVAEWYRCLWCRGVCSVRGTTTATGQHSACRGPWRVSVTLLPGGWEAGPLGGGARLGGAGHVEPASALSPASTWSRPRSGWRPGGLRSRDPGQAGHRAAQTGRVGQ